MKIVTLKIAEVIFYKLNLVRVILYRNLEEYSLDTPNALIFLVV